MVQRPKSFGVFCTHLEKRLRYNDYARNIKKNETNENKTLYISDGMFIMFLMMAENGAPGKYTVWHHYSDVTVGAMASQITNI